MFQYNKQLVQNAKTLRKNMTPEEKHLWYDFLKRLPYNVHRQHNIKNFIVDFYIAKKKIVIEVDGRQHLSRENATLDEKRDAELMKLGIRVLRYPNESIRDNFAAIARDILKNLDLNFSDLKDV